MRTFRHNACIFAWQMLKKLILTKKIQELDRDCYDLVRVDVYMLQCNREASLTWTGRSEGRAVVEQISVHVQANIGLKTFGKTF